jgi:uncharacterized membrane protein YeaQ/YmgE (transglycosylase-associated protein family)
MAWLFSIFLWILFGGIVGAIARYLVPGPQPMSLIMTVLLGVAGSFVGGGISWLIFGSPTGSINPAGWILSIIGAVIVVLAYVRFNAPRKV